MFFNNATLSHYKTKTMFWDLNFSTFCKEESRKKSRKKNQCFIFVKVKLLKKVDKKLDVLTKCFLLTSKTQTSTNNHMWIHIFFHRSKIKQNFFSSKRCNCFLFLSLSLPSHSPIVVFFNLGTSFRCSKRMSLFFFGFERNFSYIFSRSQRVKNDIAYYCRSFDQLDNNQLWMVSQ